MANNIKIRTMLDDIDEIRKNRGKKITEEQKSQPSNIVKENIKKQPKPEPSQIVQSNIWQTASPSEQQRGEEAPTSFSEKKNIISDPSAKPIAEDNDELRNLIKKISNETNKDPFDEDLAKEKVAKKNIPAAGKNDLTAEIMPLADPPQADKPADKNSKEAERTIKEDIKTEAPKKITGSLSESDNAREKNAEEINALKEDLERIELEEKIRDARIPGEKTEKIKDLERNAKEIEDLKKMISRISESAADAEKKTETMPDNAKKTIENIPENDNKEQNYKQDVQHNLQSAEAGKTEKDSASVLPKEDKDKSFWKNILEQIKKTGGSKEAVDLNRENLTLKIKTEENGGFEKYSEQSGVLQNNKQRKEELPQKKFSSKVYDKNYTPPSERLAWGKQEFYSSVAKKVKSRENKGEMEFLKEASINKNRKIISKDEEYKKLKHSIIQKYNIKLFFLPWKKIIFVAIAILALTAAASFFVFSENNPFSPIVTPTIVVGEEIEKFSSLEKEIVISKKDLQGFNNLDLEAFDIFNSDNDIKIIKMRIVDNKEEKNILSLSEALDSIRIINVKENINLPNGFLQAATNNYNIFIFKTDKGTIRYGLAIKASDKDSLLNIMRVWEKEEAKSKKMSTVFKPLFVNDKNFEDIISPFSTSFDQNVEIRYVHLINKDTALNYFFYEDILIFTTSKDTTFTMIDFLTVNN